ncbi:putative integral membrane protein (TIGR00698 family) [Balneicella halophila]|uniref:Putative integral membrane protein (TIGR00698 family) n=1 Tax=Balneicella halophila TaxID=1537566 RepID=A0A7L4USB0_BALHA|nr:putative sulfate exporter family transporter [Balneicella halophila]PVX52097.1 putative integral membrane protein (TIGR00698 family) [Balneicella halophila]
MKHRLAVNQKQLGFIYGALMVFCMFPFISPAIALFIGIGLSLVGLKHKKITNYTSFALKASIVLMGFGMSLTQVVSVSKTGFIDTAISVISVMIVGYFLARLMRIEGKIGTLISAGTAICGGSAIAAVASIVNPKNYQISFSLIVIFILNALALVLFPLIGHYFNLSQEIFGQWAAIAIHDTSSVVGAGATYGPEALQVATTVKLIRALWIIPLSLLIAFVQTDKSQGKVKIPWFILFFVVSIIIAYLFPAGETLYSGLSWMGKKGMVIALFLIGSNISVKEAQEAGLKSFIYGILLWIFIGVSSFQLLTM